MVCICGDDDDDWDDDDYELCLLCDCTPDAYDWEAMQPNLSSMLFELELGFTPASKLTRRKNQGLCGESLRNWVNDSDRRNVPEHHRALVERGIDILGENSNDYFRIEVWEIDFDLEAQQGYVFRMFPRGFLNDDGDDYYTESAVMVDMVLINLPKEGL